MSRDVFLDYETDEVSIETQFQRLLQTAHEKGTALGIGHPHEATLRVLQRELSTLNDYGVRLVPVRRLAKMQSEEEPAWQLSLSRLPRDVKNLRR